MFRFAVEPLGKGKAVPALCKDDQTVWAQLGMKFQGCHCLLSAEDSLARQGTKPIFPKLAPALLAAPEKGRS